MPTASGNRNPGTASRTAEVFQVANLRVSSLRARWKVGAGLILYLWSVRPSYDLSLRLLVPFLFVGPPIAAARGRHDFVAVAIETAAAVFFFYFGGVMLNDLCDLE